MTEHYSGKIAWQIRRATWKALSHGWPLDAVIRQVNEAGSNPHPEFDDEHITDIEQGATP